MSRYYSQPRAYWIDEDGDAMQVVDGVSVPEHHPVDTGLLDVRGDPIMRAPYPIGFGRDEEWA